MTGAELALNVTTKPPDKKSPQSPSPSSSGGSGNLQWSSKVSAMTFKEMSLTLQHVGALVPAPLTRKEIINLLVHE